MLRKIAVDEAVGTRLAHDLTEIRPGEFKGAAFQKGHLVCNEDLCRLQKMGKNHLYAIELEEDEIHENQAAAILAESLAGPGVDWEDEPREGRIGLSASIDGLLKVDIPALAAFNMVEEVMCASRHNNTLVKAGQLVAATRAIPLVMKRHPIERAASLARQHGHVLEVKPLSRLQVGLIITGNEIFHGLIEDRFQEILAAKIDDLGSMVTEVDFCPDNRALITTAIRRQVAAGCGLLLLTGGMSVDPDDVTRLAIADAGAGKMHYGSAVLPGAMFMVAYLDQVPLLGIPACGLHHRATVLDLVLPRILANERIGRSDLALLGHGGLCHDCPECRFPDCSFGCGS